MQIQLSQRQKEIATGLTILAVFVIGFGGAEALLRINQLLTFGFTRSVETSDRFYIDQPTGLRLPVPGSTHGTIGINSLGFRSPEIEPAKPDGVIRIAFLGSSATYDPYVKDNERTWPHLTWRALGERFPECRFDYINAGVPGMGTASIQTYYEHFVKKTSPDIVIILANDQNGDLDKLAGERGLLEAAHYRPSWLAGISLFWTKVEKNALIVRRQRAAFRDVDKLDFEPAEITDEFEQRMTHLISAIHDSDALPIVLSYDNRLRPSQNSGQQIEAVATLLLYMPYMSVTGLLKARDAYNSALEAVARNTATPFLDWRDVVPGDAIHFADSSHFSREGSRVMAAHMAQRLAESQQVRERIQRGSACSTNP